MKDEYLKAYQQRIEEIKALDVSPKEKRKLAADAKNEILEQYKASYVKENNGPAMSEVQAPVQSTPVQSEEVVETKDEQEIISPEVPQHLDAAEDPIDNILTKLEEREERGEVGIDMDAPTEFINPDALFETMDLNELFSSLGIEDEVEDGLESDSVEGNVDDIDDIFLDSDDLFAGLLDDFEDELNSEVISEQFDLGHTMENLVPNKAITEQAADTFNSIVKEEATIQPTATYVNTQTVSTIETDVEEIEELVEGAIIDDQDEIEPVAEVDHFSKVESDTSDVLASTVASEEVTDTEIDDQIIAEEQTEELEELEKERDRAQRLGIIELVLVVILILLVIAVVYMITRGV